MPVRAYNTRQGIIEALGSLESFRALIAARHAAYYERSESLTEFYVLGRYVLDTCGNFGILMADRMSKIPKELFPGIPDVLEKDALWAYLHARGAGDTSIGWGTRPLPYPNIPCAICERTWEMADAHENVAEFTSKVEDLSGFVGRTLGEFTTSLLERTDASYRIQFGAPICSNGEWLEYANKPSDGYIIREGDAAGVDVRTFYHPICRRNVMAAQTESNFQLVFCLAGFSPRDFELRRTANAYGSEDYHGPWFEAKTAAGTITIGWRKSVIAIDWSATGRKLLHLFDDVTDTKSETGIHAWSYAQAIDYLGRINRALANTPARV